MTMPPDERPMAANVYDKTLMPEDEFNYSTDPDRQCDFCSLHPSTHWITFRISPVGIRIGMVMPLRLSACKDCIGILQQRNHAELMPVISHEDSLLPPGAEVANLVL